MAMENGGKSGATAEQVRQGLRDVQGELQDRLEGLRGYAENLDGWIRSMARERPLLAIGLAVGVGFLVGRIASRV